MRTLLLSLLLALAVPVDAAIFGLFKDDLEILSEGPESARELRAVSEDATARAREALAAIRAQVADGCLVSVLHDPSTTLVPLTDSCAPGTQMAPYYAMQLPRVRIESKKRLLSIWPKNNALLMDAFAAEVRPLARRHFPRNYNVGIGERAVTGYIEGVVASIHVEVQGSEFLLRDGRTVLVVRTVYKRDRQITLDGSKSGGGYYAFSLQVGLLDVRNLPSRWGLMIEDERTFRTLAHKAVGDAPLDVAVRAMAAEFWRPLDPVYLQPEGGQALDDERLAFAKAFAEKRWDGIERQIKDSAGDFEAISRMANRGALGERSAINRAAAAAAAHERSAIFAGVIQGAHSAARDLQRREAQFARTRRDAQRFYGTGGGSSSGPRRSLDSDPEDEAEKDTQAEGSSDAAAPEDEASAASSGSGGGGSASSGGRITPSLTATPAPATAPAPANDACRYDPQEMSAADRLGERCHERPFRQGAFCTAKAVPFTSGGRCLSAAEARASAEQQFRQLEGRALGNRQLSAEGTSNRRYKELCPSPDDDQTARANFTGMRCAEGKVSVGSGWGRGLYCIGEYTYRCEPRGPAGGSAGR